MFPSISFSMKQIVQAFFLNLRMSESHYHVINTGSDDGFYNQPDNETMKCYGSEIGNAYGDEGREHEWNSVLQKAGESISYYFL